LWSISATPWKEKNKVVKYKYLQGHAQDNDGEGEEVVNDIGTDEVPVLDPALDFLLARSQSTRSGRRIQISTRLLR